MTPAENRLKFWLSLAKLADTNGMPPDLIWVKLDEIGHPIAKENTSEEFESRLKECVQLLQGTSRLDNFDKGSPLYQTLALTQELQQNA